MLQRIQTIYLMLAAGASGGLIYAFYLWGLDDGTQVWAKDVNYVFAAFLTSAFFSVVAIFRYKNRKSQFMLGRLNIILNFILLGFFVYQSLISSGEFYGSEKGVGLFIPIISIVFLALANKAIKKDEDLVKSVDRLR
ncbi:DUF4293 domain-containing protein [Seonamhaeicola aphaedonensis]|uniref:Uncharacterized protein DUF4293 n=1 Tax=Seonamhaeicola aphaedonensis TaxID=1461338 RepID=A0A3D9HD68_9FLAO|nr:DUF4293 domain-containing protein [Seonamhaeicola aphaedonensis]RED47418.1 uncharacterized protein DUF4293 [Seonamhaeicola aphaedonensis]